MRDLVALADGLRRHLANGAAVTGVRVLSAGHSNETYLVEGLDRILRLPPSSAPLLPLALGTARQFDLFAVLHGRDPAIPIPALDYMCDDPAVLGDPFFLMERVDGIPWTDWGAPEWIKGCGDDFLGGISRQALGAITALHRKAPLDVLGPVLDNRAELKRWRNLVEGVMSPDLHRLFTMAEMNIPPLVQAAPCHGDPKYPNMLWRDGRLNAVLDWEMAFNGDPRWDLAYMLLPLAGPCWESQPGMDEPGLWQRDRIIAEWQNATGRPADQLAWFEAATVAKVSAIVLYGHHLFITGQSSDERFRSWNQPAADYARRGLAILEGLPQRN